MHEIQRLSDSELHARALAVARKEQVATLITLAHLREVERRRLHLKMGFGSLFRYAVEALGFSEPAASQRIGAMRLAAQVPEAEQRLKTGELKLSSAAAIERFVRQEERATGRVVTPAEQARMVEEVRGKPYRDAERTLLTFAKTPESHRQKETTRPVTPTRTEVRFYAGEKVMADLRRVRELKGDVTLEAIFEEALEHYLRKIDVTRRPSRKPPAQDGRQQSTTTSECGQGSASKTHELKQAVESSERAVGAERPAGAPGAPAAEDLRYVPARLRRQVLERSGGRGLCRRPARATRWFLGGLMGRACDRERIARNSAGTRSRS